MHLFVKYEDRGPRVYRRTLARRNEKCLKGSLHFTFTRVALTGAEKASDSPQPALNLDIVVRGNRARGIHDAWAAFRQTHLGDLPGIVVAPARAPQGSDRSDYKKALGIIL